MASTSLRSSSPEATPALLPVENRRLHPRHAVSLAITMLSDQSFYAGFTEDISEGGVFIATYQVLPVGTVVTLSLYLGELESPYEILGTVRWLRGHDVATDDEAKTGVGVQFEKISIEAVAAIRAFVSKTRSDFQA